MANLRKKFRLREAQRARRARRVRAKIFGTSTRPRLAVSVSLSGIFVQFIDDKSGKTLLSGRSHKLAGNKMAQAAALGADLAKTAREKNIVEIVFDRSAKQYHGRVKAFAEALRAGGLKF